MQTLGIDNMVANMLVPYYLMSCYLYYEKNVQVLSDQEFDTVCKRLLDEWDSVQHFHKHLITKQDLVAGTGYALKYNNRIKNGALAWYAKYESKV